MYLIIFYVTTVVGSDFNQELSCSALRLRMHDDEHNDMRSVDCQFNSDLLSDNDIGFSNDSLITHAHSSSPRHSHADFLSRRRELRKTKFFRIIVL